MKITLMTALAAATLAFAPMAHAEGNGDPFPFGVASVGAVRFTDGVAVALDDGPSTALYAARDEAPLQPTAEVAELPAERGFAESDALAR